MNAWLRRWSTVMRREGSAGRDLIIILAVCLSGYLVIDTADQSWRLFRFIGDHPEYDLDDWFLTMLMAGWGMLFFAVRRWRDLHRAQAEARALASHDALTGLPNKRQLEERLAARWHQPDGRVSGVLTIDLDYFGSVNDRHGRRAGDRLLQAVALRLRESIAAEVAMVARSDGDRFAVLLDQADHVDDVAHLARRIMRLLTPPFALDGAAIAIGCSIGGAIMPVAVGGPETLLRHADIALQQAKTGQRGAFRFFEPSMDAAIQQRLQREAALREAIRLHEIHPHYQPVVDLRCGTLLGYEVLARWTHPTLGSVPPSDFIALAEDIGLIVALGDSVLAQACREARGFAGTPWIAVNVSAAQLHDPALAERIAGIVAATGFPANRLELEITESLLVNDYAMAAATIRRLRALGMRVTLDDFGSGHSSLRHLQQLPFDKLKIDASFVATMATDESNRSLVAAIAGLSHSLGLPIVAEGIETPEQAATLRQMGFDQGQGWYFGRPCAAGMLVAAPAPDAPPG